MKLIVSIIIVLVAVVASEHKLSITAYHFASFFFQNNRQSIDSAVTIRSQLLSQINSGVLRHCVVNKIQVQPPCYLASPTGICTACCNQTSLAPAISWFMQNHGDLSTCLIPLSTRLYTNSIGAVTWLGQPVPLDITHIAIVPSTCPNGLNGEAELYAQHARCEVIEMSR